MTKDQSHGREENAAVPDSEVLKKNGGKVGEDASWKSESGKDRVPGADDLTGPAGDPAEGKRPGGSSYPA